MLRLGSCFTGTNKSSAHITTIDDYKLNYQYRIKPVELTSKAWITIIEMNKSIVLEGQVEGHVSQYQGGGKG